MHKQLLIRYLGNRTYKQTWEAMQHFTQQRTANTKDEFWVVEHPPVFTQGQAGKSEHILNPGDIPIVQTDRGGQVTYHGPGQLVLYTLIDIQRKHLAIRTLINALENALIALLKDYNIPASTRCGAPGVYVEDAKIASLGLRIRRGCSYHGLSLNVNMDLEPFTRINPCGYSDLKVTQISIFKPGASSATVTANLVTHLMQGLGYTVLKETQGFEVP